LYGNFDTLAGEVADIFGKRTIAAGCPTNQF
jgi:hypothetical protein